MQEIQPHFPWWEVLMGSANLLIAVSVAIIAHRSSRKDKVEEQVQDDVNFNFGYATEINAWIKDFRENISEILSVAEFLMDKKGKTKSLKWMKRFYEIRNNIYIISLGFQNLSDFDSLMNYIFVLEGEVKDDDRSMGKFYMYKELILNCTMEIINHKYSISGFEDRLGEPVVMKQEMIGNREIDFDNDLLD